MTPLSPEQWRILNHLHRNGQHMVWPKLTEVRDSQKITDDDLLDLDGQGLISANANRDDFPLDTFLRSSGRMVAFAKRLRLHLTRAGLHRVLDDPGNQIRYTLGRRARPITLAKLFDGNTIVIDDVSTQQTRGLVSVALPDFGEIELADTGVLFGEILKVTITAKGREYLPL